LLFKNRDYFCKKDSKIAFIMLVQFSVRNYKIFKDEAKLTLFASNSDTTTRESENVFEVPKFGLRLLKSAVMYGANASGKTKLVNAAKFMKEFMLKSSKESQEGEPIKTEPYRLSTATENQPSMFELVFIQNNDMFRYGFEATKEKVLSEWLYYRPNTKEIEVFFREGQEFTIHSTHFKKGKLLKNENIVRSNALMLSVAAQFNDELAGRVFQWLRNFHILSGLHEDEYMGYSMLMADNEVGKKKALEWLKHAGIGVDNIRPQTINVNELPTEIQGRVLDMVKKNEETRLFSDLVTVHAKYDASFSQVGNEEFALLEEESSGTQKFFALNAPIIHAIDQGDVLFIDELDSKIHPNLVCKIIEVFNSKKTNPKNAQLIFNTHDTNLLSSNLFRRDQIWFAEKDRYGAATIYPLSSFKTNEGARKGDKYEENYISGRYGGVPVLNEFSELFYNKTLKENER